MLKSFDDEIKKMQEKRHFDEWLEGKRRKIRGEDIYTRFVAWCYSEGKPEWKANFEQFEEYLKMSNIELDFWKRKAIGETHFGERYDWNGKEWEIVK